MNAGRDHKARSGSGEAHRSCTPVIIGVAQKTRRREELPGPEPLIGWAEAVRLAADDAGLSARDLAAADLVSVVDLISWTYDDAPGRLAEQIGAHPGRTISSKPSGTSGHTLVFDAADAIRRGDCKLAVLAGGESLATRHLLAQQGVSPAWSHPAPPGVSSIDYGSFQHPSEVALGLYEGVGAIYLFAMRDVARRAHLGIAPDEYRQQIGEMMAGLTRVAARNPDAWFRTERTPSFLAEPRPDNRKVAHPYTKHLVAMWNVDISGAIIMCSEEEADRLGIARSKRIYPWLATYAEDATYTASRRDLWKSHAMEAAAGALYRRSGLSAAQIAHADLYSCFPSALNFSSDALGFADRGGEGLTVTGGLPYSGGPGSSYMITSIGKLTQRLRSDPGSFGIASGVGMMMQKHAYGLYSSEPPPPFPGDQDGDDPQAEADAIAPLRIDTDYRGPATVAAYTIVYDREGGASHAAAICDLGSGDRAYARIQDADWIAQAERDEMVGTTGLLTGGSKVADLVV